MISPSQSRSNFPKLIRGICIAVHLASCGSSSAATLSIEQIDSESAMLHLSQDPASYFFLQQSYNLSQFTPFSMVLGDTAHFWNLYYNPETPARFFRSRIISIHAPEDTDHDGIDDLYEIRHPVLNPLDPYDAALNSGNQGLSFLEEYRQLYDLGDGKHEAISNEISVFNTRPFNGPTHEAISDEVSVFNTRPFLGPTHEAISDEVSVFNTRPFTGPMHEAISDEVSIFNIRPFVGPTYEAISDEVSVNNTIPTS